MLVSPVTRHSRKRKKVEEGKGQMKRACRLGDKSPVVPSAVLWGLSSANLISTLAVEQMAHIVYKLALHASFITNVYMLIRYAYIWRSAGA